MSFDITIECHECGSELSIEGIGNGSFQGMPLYVEPCQHCLEQARLNGYDNGKDEGYEAGKEVRG